MKPYIVAFVFARGGFKGVPRKNLRDLGGKPLLAHAIDRARCSRYVDRVVVSTDDEEIAAAAREWGAETPFMRPPDLAQDSSSEWLAWRHAITTLEQLDGGRTLDVFVSSPPTAPMGATEDIDHSIRAILETEADVTLTVSPSARSPYFNMVVIEDGWARVAIRPQGAVIRRQDAPQVYDVTTVAYAARPCYVLEAPSILAGKVHAVVVPPERAIDIDTELDLQFAQFLFERNAITKAAMKHEGSPG